MELKPTLERIEREKKFGDVADAGRAAGLSAQVYKNARSKQTFEELTSAEWKILEAILKILDDRKALQDKITSNNADQTRA